MNRYIAVCLSCIILCWACASSKLANRQASYKSVSLTLCRATQVQDEIEKPLDETDKFSPYEKQVVAHISFENFSGSRDISWQWCETSNDMCHTSDVVRLQTSKGKYVKWATASHALTIAGKPPSTRPGQWNVKILLDGKPFRSKSFMIQDPSMVVAPLPAQGAKQSPNRWGVIIGIEEYKGLPNAAYAINDAEKMKAHFEKILGIPKENILTLIDADATKAQIEGAVKNWLPANIQRNATVYVYFSGHGAPDVGGGQPYLVPHDADPRLGTTGYPREKFHEDLSKLKARRVFVFLDACFSGIARGSTEMLVSEKATLIPVPIFTLSSETVVWMSAASTNQTGISLEKAEHGLFTFYLLRALGGAADANADQSVSIKETFEYVTENVTRMARLQSQEQTPEISPPIDRLKGIRLCKVAQKQMGPK